MELLLTRCTVRDWRQGDEESLAHHANNKNIWNNVRDQFPSPYLIEDAHWWIREGCKKHGTVSLAIEVDGTAVGGIGLVLKEDIYRHTAELGYWLGEKYWRRGIMTEAVAAMTAYGFSHFGLARIWAGVFEWNSASIRVLEKAGYHYEARLRNNLIKNGITGDELIYACLK